MAVTSAPSSTEDPGGHRPGSARETPDATLAVPGLTPDQVARAESLWRAHWAAQGIEVPTPNGTFDPSAGGLGWRLLHRCAPDLYPGVILTRALARFEGERQARAWLNNSHLAYLLRVGEDDQHGESYRWSLVHRYVFLVGALWRDGAPPEQTLPWLTQCAGSIGTWHLRDSLDSGQRFTPGSHRDDRDGPASTCYGCRTGTLPPWWHIAEITPVRAAWAMAHSYRAALGDWDTALIALRAQADLTSVAALWAEIRAANGLDDSAADDPARGVAARALFATTVALGGT